MSETEIPWLFFVVTLLVAAMFFTKVVVGLFVATKSARVCSACGQSLPRDAKFCSRCGKPAR